MQQNIIQEIKAGCLPTVLFKFVFEVPYHVSQIMRLSFVLAVVATFKLAASMVIRDSDDNSCPESCMTRDCCSGYYCQVITTW
ncbi:hypothetical protein BDR03DRAFT_969617 [Suillus americanus]|nr:hypothetical protein BDR03DRAFT_969617 [Suillus americanus]